MHLSSSAELRAFDATARCGSMSAAARLLGIRQPTVSAHIASLEQSFGVELFQRHGRRIVLTGFGRLLHEITQRIYRGEEQAVALLLAARQGYQGLLTIGAIGPHNVMPMVKRFREQNPTVRVVVAVGDSREVVHRVLDQKDDIGILLHAVDDERVHCLPLRKQPLVVFAPTTHPLARCETLTLSDLNGVEFVLREDGSHTRQVFESGLAAAGVKVRCSVEMGSREAVREAVAQGLGLGVVARTAFVPDSRVLELKVEGLNMHTHVHVICLRERKEAALIKGFLELVGELSARRP
ncbi:MAG: LysR family transcriptional regulator [Betaproteobacteria bacterium HGW-Betaproteobacteria-7]|jgi:aminoethylphosphonate catabolism LysR family transcriptional regulator|nr:MAG: LysR family transcriptional regulator [Betaproteobacteria bacterium HGW-Betaproteobacteria-7]